jgi:hypothetical protein
MGTENKKAFQEISRNALYYYAPPVIQSCSTSESICGLT